MKINWQEFGLKTNPYDTLPLIEGSALSLEEAFIGREKERTLTNTDIEHYQKIIVVLTEADKVMRKIGMNV